VPKPGVSRQNIVAGKRASRSSRVVQEVDSEDEEEDDDDAEEVDAMDVDEDSEDNDVDAEGDEDEDMIAEGDEDDDIEDTPAPRIVVNTNRSIPVKPAPTIKLTKAQDTVEAKEMAMDDDDDDELSDPDSDLEDEDAEGEDEDAEGEEDDEMGVTPLGDRDEEMDSDEDLSRDQTPDMSKMTKRQRALINDENDSGGLMALSNEAQKKKHLTAEEHAMRRAEMARRRKNLSEKRNEEEKVKSRCHVLPIVQLLTPYPARHNQPSAQETTTQARPQSHRRARRIWSRNRAGAGASEPSLFALHPECEGHATCCSG
jgi:Ino eighty subunit 2